MFYGAGRASVRAAECIYDALALSHPVDARARATDAGDAGFSHVEPRAGFAASTPIQNHNDLKVLSS
jgi:hypothetical protein